jgi:hypothetical protein
MRSQYSRNRNERTRKTPQPNKDLAFAALYEEHGWNVAPRAVYRLHDRRALLVREAWIEPELRDHLASRSATASERTVDRTFEKEGHLLDGASLLDRSRDELFDRRRDVAKKLVEHLSGHGD